MRYLVNDNCIGCRLCALTCPEVFSMGESGTAVAIHTQVPDRLLTAASEAMENCPAAAIQQA